MAGVFVGLFAYCLLVLRTVRSETEGGAGFVPSTSITVAIVLGIAALGLLLVFIHHVTRTIQASEITASITHATLKSLGDLYPKPFGNVPEEPEAELVESWRREAQPRLVYPDRPGYVQAVELDDLAEALEEPRLRAYIRVCPGDFATPSEPVAELWDGTTDADAAAVVRKRILVGGERTLAQDTAFGVRQLADIAIRALSPTLNDPTTAVTCARYLGVILARLAERSFPPAVRRIEGATLVARHRAFVEFVDVAFVELGRHAARDVRVAEALLEATAEVARRAAAAGARDRAELVARAAEEVLDAAEDDAESAADQARLRRAAERVYDAAGAAMPVSSRMLVGQQPR